MNQHTLQALEFHRVRELLVARAASQPGAERAAELQPAASLDEARRLLALVEEALSLSAEEPNWPRLAFPDIRVAVEAAHAQGSFLEPPDLVAIGAFLLLSRQAGRSLRSPAARARRPMLFERAAALFEDASFEERIARSFEPSGEVSDRASPELSRLRRRLLGMRQQAGARLEELARRMGSEEESVVTLRGGRYVLSVPSGEKRRVKGIVHDRSATGKTLFLEPLEIVEVNNALAEAEADERAEVRRILLEMTGWVREHAGELRACLACLAELDELDARARLARDLKASRPELQEDAKRLKIVAGRHPLLFLSLGDRVVPLDLALEGERRGVIVSGPNMGGKTVILKTVGLLVLMAASGLFVPAAEGTVIPWIDALLVDIGDEQSLDSDLSTYGARLRNMQAMLAAASDRSLALLDELGTGTDPEEGSALGRALLLELGRRGAMCVVTTHHGSFKSFAAETPGFENAAVEHDPRTLRPTFRLRLGLPGRSHAFELARRERWPERALEEAARFLSEEGVRSEELLTQIEAHRQELERAREEAGRREKALETDREELKQLTEDLRRRANEVAVAKAVEEDRRLREIGELLRSLRGKLEQWERAEPPADRDSLRQSFHAQEREAAGLVKSQRPIPRSAPAPAGAPLPVKDARPGKRAYARSLGFEVEILGGDEESGQVWVSHKGMRIALPPRDLSVLEPSERPGGAVDTGGESRAEWSRARPAPKDPREEAQERVSAEVDLRGLTGEECRERLELYLDRALLAGYPRIRIIHGKGGGVLRRIVREMLRGHDRVRSFRDGEPFEGDWGVTIALLGEEVRRGDEAADEAGEGR